MTEEAGQPTVGLCSYRWSYAYKTSAMTSASCPVDILHDFYIPALQRSIRYHRIAGYFRSTSLAVASQGFSAFVGRNGHMRLIVGADLDPADVQAILQGDSERLAMQLNRELERQESWPEQVTHGVELLAWMVAHGYLDVRVAFRVHGKTGTPMPFTSVADGYVHEKWAIFTDEYDNRLYISGSLNESRTALTLNAENIDVHCDWWGERERQRVDSAAADFEHIWKDEHPFLRVLHLPEAVRQRLIAIGATVEHPREVDGSSAAPPVVAPPVVVPPPIGGSVDPVPLPPSPIPPAAVPPPTGLPVVPPVNSAPVAPIGPVTLPTPPLAPPPVPIIGGLL